MDLKPVGRLHGSMQVGFRESHTEYDMMLERVKGNVYKFHILYYLLVMLFYIQVQSQMVNLTLCEHKEKPDHYTFGSCFMMHARVYQKSAEETCLKCCFKLEVGISVNNSTFDSKLNYLKLLPKVGYCLNGPNSKICS